MLRQLKLDDETFAEIVEQARLRATEYLPEWNDLNTHDPGITLIELFAWLTEQQRFYLDQSEDAAVFFPLLCIAPHSAAAAEVNITIHGGFPAKRIPANTPLYAEYVRFETVTDIYYTGAPQHLTVVQRETIPVPFTLGYAHGFPTTRFTVDTRNRIILRDSFSIEVDGEAWTRTDNFHYFLPQHKHYTLNEETGEVVFGDGINGAIPKGDVIVTSMAVTLGAGGNIAPRRINELVGLPVSQAEAAEGGRAGETVSETTARAWNDHRQAVTTQGIEQIILEIPALGSQVERVHAYTGSVMPMPGEPRIIYIAVKLKSGKLNDSMKNQIYAHLEPYRLVCRKFKITEPKIVRVDIALELRTGPHGMGFIDALKDIIRDYFVSQYGNFGIKLKVSQIRALVAAVPEVLEVYRCAFHVIGDARTDALGDISLQPHSLAELGEISIRV